MIKDVKLCCFVFFRRSLFDAICMIHLPDLVSNFHTKKIKSSLYLRFYAVACNSAALCMSNTAPKKRHHGGEPLATLCPIGPARQSNADLSHRLRCLFIHIVTVTLCNLESKSSAAVINSGSWIEVTGKSEN